MECTEPFILRLRRQNDSACSESGLPNQAEEPGEQVELHAGGKSGAMLDVFANAAYDGLCSTVRRLRG